VFNSNCVRWGHRENEEVRMWSEEWRSRNVEVRINPVKSAGRIIRGSKNVELKACSGMSGLFDLGMKNYDGRFKIWKSAQEWGGFFFL